MRRLNKFKRLAFGLPINRLFRCVKTIQEIRESAWHVEQSKEYGKQIKIRKYIPTLYDDIIIHRQKSWKSLSKRQKQFN